MMNYIFREQVTNSFIRKENVGSDNTKCPNIISKETHQFTITISLCQLLVFNAQPFCFDHECI